MARTTVTINLNTAKIQNRIDQVLEAYGPVIGFQLQQEISKDQFEYTDDEGKPVITRRKTGRTVGSPRDIVDTGELLNSQTEPQVGSGVLTIKWLARYSKAVLEGNYLVGTVRNSYLAKPRDWITPALKNQPFLPYFVQTWKRLTKQ